MTEWLIRSSLISKVLAQQLPFLLNMEWLLWMGFEPYQRKSKLESVSKFTDYMKYILEETMSAIYKSQKDIAKYYNWKYTPVQVFHSSNKISLDFLNIYTIHPSAKLFHYCLKPYILEKQVEFILYCPKLSLTL